MTELQQFGQDGSKITRDFRIVNQRVCVCVCVGGGGAVATKPERCVSQCWALLNNALYCATHPTSTSNVGPTARILSSYVDVVFVGQWVVLPQTDGRLRVVLVNSQHYLVFLSSSCAGNGSFLVHDNVLHQQTVNMPLCSLGNTRFGQKVPGLSSEGAVRRHCAAQGRTVNWQFYEYLLALRLREAVRLNTVRCGARQIATHPCTWPNLCSRC
jgi:hypothetical protein